MIRHSSPTLLREHASQACSMIQPQNLTRRHIMHGSPKHGTLHQPEHGLDRLLPVGCRTRDRAADGDDDVVAPRHGQAIAAPEDAHGRARAPAQRAAAPEVQHLALPQAVHGDDVCARPSTTGAWSG